MNIYEHEQLTLAIWTELSQGQEKDFWVILRTICERTSNIVQDYINRFVLTWIVYFVVSFQINLSSSSLHQELLMKEDFNVAKHFGKEEQIIGFSPFEYFKRRNFRRGGGI